MKAHPTSVTSIGKVLLEKALAAKREAEQKALAAQRTRENNGHEEVMRELAAFRKRMRKENQQRAAQVRDGTPTSPGTHVVREMLHLPQGNEVRSAERLWRHVREQRESAYLENARDTREKALGTPSDWMVRKTTQTGVNASRAEQNAISVRAAA